MATQASLPYGLTDIVIEPLDASFAPIAAAGKPTSSNACQAMGSRMRPACGSSVGDGPGASEFPPSGRADASGTVDASQFAEATGFLPFLEAAPINIISSCLSGRTATA